MSKLSKPQPNLNTATATVNSCLLVPRTAAGISDMTGQPLPDDPGPPITPSHTSPGDSSPPAPVPSYSEKLKVNVVRSERLKRNVLEIQIIADNGSDTNVDKETVAKLLAKLGIDWKTNMQGYQLSWKRIYVWFKESFDIKRFCYVDSKTTFICRA